MGSIQFDAIAPCRHGWMLWPKTDTAIGRALGLYGEFAEGENRLLASYIKPGETVVDVGANLGTTVRRHRWRWGRARMGSTATVRRFMIGTDADWP